MRGRFGLAFAALCAACRPSHSPDALRLADFSARFAAGDWALMTSPIQPPMSPHERQRITVWLRVARGETLRTRWIASQHRYVLSYPPGTDAERIEARLAGGLAHPVDVRGTEFLSRGRERFHVLRRDPDGGGMIGWAWTRGDALAQRRASRALVAVVAREPGADVPFFRGNMDCAGCHVHDEPRPARASRGRPPMATDSGGLFRVMTVLEDRAPLAESRAHDPNLDSRFVTLSCASGTPIVVRTKEDAERARCPRGDVPMAVYDMRAALGAGSRHAEAVCRSRAFLRAHIDALGRRVFREAFAECRVSPRT